MSNFKETLRKFYQNLGILEERRAKYAGNAPLDLLNQIEDHKTAIDLTEQALAGSMSEDEWRAALKPLLLAFDRNIFLDPNNVYDRPPPPLSPAEAKERRELNILLQKVKQFWIEGVLEKSLHNIALIDLGKETQADAVAHAWEQVLELPDQNRQTLPPDKKISHIFDEMNRALLILGAPGSGKTITLLQLARDLIAQAEQDETFSQPIPVVFNLSTWQRGQPLVDWLVEELSVKYQIPKRIGRPWLETNRLLPLLDGLDEVKEEDRTACVEAINHFGQEYGLSGLVVCSRTEEYTRLPVRLKLNGAIRLQPLTLEQVYDYLDAAGEELTALRTALEVDEGLQSLAQTPLTLGVMVLAYQGLSVEGLVGQAKQSLQARRHHLFETYIERMFRRKGQGDEPYSDDHTKKRLAWLAEQMMRHNLTIFLIEGLQPSWITDKTGRWAYAIGSRLLLGLFVGFLAGLNFVVFENIIKIEIFGPYFWPFVGITSGLSIGLLEGFRFSQEEKSNPGASPNKSRNEKNLSFSDITGIILFQWFIFVLVFLLVQGVTWAFPIILFGGLSFGIGSGLIWLLRNRAQKRPIRDDIQPTEALTWKWRPALNGIVIGVFFGIFFGLFWGMVWGLIWGMNSQIFPSIGSGLSNPGALWELGSVEVSVVQFGVVFGLAGFSLGGLRRHVEKSKTFSNQGIRLSLRNALFTGIIGALMMSVSYWIGTGLVHGFVNIGSIIIALNIGFLFGLGASLWYGGPDVVQHLTLRFILWRTGQIPWNMAHFLNYATERIFLQKVGGGYIFIHRLLLEHFAAMGGERTRRDAEQR